MGGLYDVFLKTIWANLNYENNGEVPNKFAVLNIRAQINKSYTQS